MVSRKEVALLAGVSEATVSNVITGNRVVLDEKRERVLDAINKLNYIPDQTARNLAMRRSNHIGIAIYEITNPYHMEIAKKIEEYAIREGYIVSLFMLDNNMADKLEVITQRRLDGLVNFMTNQYPANFIETLVKMGTVLINFDRSVGSVFVNDYSSAVEEILRRMKEYGHSKIAYISCMDEVGFAADSRGKQWAKSTAELGFESADVIYNHNYDETSEKVGYTLAKQLIAGGSGATALMCTNDLAAIGCIRALAEAGIRVPDDVSVVGCDDIDLAKILVPSLTSITIDKTMQGEDIARQVIEQIKTKKKVGKTYPATPIFRESLKEVKKNS